jgi:hypothetical protein
MLPVKNTVIAAEVLQKAFVCDLTRCKGACCVEGDSGAPLEPEEAAVLESIFPQVVPFLRPEGVQAIREQGTSVVDSDGDLVTPLRDGQECAYTVFDPDGTAKCGIEQAYRAGAVPFIKPISCHLYPIRITKYRDFEAVNYHQWDICQPACALGEALQVPVYAFLKEPLIRRYGPDWYAEVEKAATEST